MRVSSKEEALEIIKNKTMAFKTKYQKIEDKATYIKKEMRKDKKELGTFVRTGDTEWRLSK